MSKSKYNYKVYNGKAIKKMLEDSRIYFLTALFIIGLVSGVTAVKNNSILNEKISLLIDSFSILKSEQGIVQNFINSICISGIFMLINTFFGFSLIGYPFLIFLPLLRGMGIGAVCGYLYGTYKLLGLGYCVLIIYPGAIVATFALILACNDSCEYSKNAFSKAIQGKGQFEKDETRVYLIRQLVFTGICALSSIIDALFSVIFSRFFEV